MKKPALAFTNHREYLAKRLRNSTLKRAYDDLELEFAIIGALIDARAKKGMTQAKLAKKIGTKQSAIARFEAGKSNPTLAFVQKLTDALDLDLKVSVRNS